MADHYSTQAVHAGEDRRKPCGALTTPVYHTSTYTFADTGEILEFMRRKSAGDWPLRDEYGRYSNPTQSAAERKLAALERGERALLFGSGMCAITTTLLTFLSAGDHMVMASDAYHRTKDFAQMFLTRWGIETTMVRIGRPDEIEAAMRPASRLLFAETPTNPYLRIADIARLVEIARRRNVLSVIDSTFATPINLRPLELGVDLVVHSATKYLGGHNDLLAGVVVGSHRLVAQIEKTRGVVGGVSNPHDAYQLIRGLKTLELRVLRQNESGLRLARFLESHGSVERVYYPGLASHPDHDLAKRQMTGFGGVVSFEIKGDFLKTGRFIDALRLPFVGPTLGGVESVVQQNAVLFSLDPAEWRAGGITDNLVRYAIGIENVEDLIADLDQALAQIG
ncbi:MAG: aminotransferase class I/II-fold pyridoxal phosphate-dependent enzyme [Acidobacteriota bacterium]